MGRHPSIPAGPAKSRASDADRERVGTVIREHWEAGRLTDEEFEARLGAALGARTLGQLRGLVGDLPAPPPMRPSPAGRAVSTSRRGVAHLFRAVGAILKPILITVGVLALALVALGAIIDATGGDERSGRTYTSSIPTADPKLELTRLDRGERGVDGDFAFRLVSIRAADSVRLRAYADEEPNELAPPEGRRFIIAAVETTNRSDRSGAPFCGSNGARLLSRAGRGVELIDRVYTVEGNDAMCSRDLTPEGTAEFQLVFSVPRGTRPKSLDVWDSRDRNDISGRADRLRIAA